MANAVPVHAPEKPAAKKPLSKDAQKIKKELEKAEVDAQEVETPVEDKVTTMADGTIRKDF